jgi:D-arabinose 1-dehydrogenase-like Zn-dependent alcohol dehydrogenase
MTERARLTKIGWEEDLAIETGDAPLAEPSGNQILVEVEACGVCFRDCIERHRLVRWRSHREHAP